MYHVTSKMGCDLTIAAFQVRYRLLARPRVLTAQVAGQTAPRWCAVYVFSVSERLPGWSAEVLKTRRSKASSGKGLGKYAIGWNSSSRL